MGRQTQRLPGSAAGLISELIQYLLNHADSADSALRTKRRDSSTHLLLQVVVFCGLLLPGLYILQGVLLRHLALARNWRELKHKFRLSIAAFGLYVVVAFCMVNLCFACPKQHNFVQRLLHFFLFSSSWVERSSSSRPGLIDLGSHTLIQTLIALLGTALFKRGLQSQAYSRSRQAYAANPKPARGERRLETDLQCWLLTIHTALLDLARCVEAAGSVLVAVLKAYAAFPTSKELFDKCGKPSAPHYLQVELNLSK